MAGNLGQAAAQLLARLKQAQDSLQSARPSRPNSAIDYFALDLKQASGAHGGHLASFHVAKTVRAPGTARLGANFCWERRRGGVGLLARRFQVQALWE